MSVIVAVPVTVYVTVGVNEGVRAGVAVQVKDCVAVLETAGVIESVGVAVFAGAGGDEGLEELLLQAVGKSARQAAAAA